MAPTKIVSATHDDDPVILPWLVYGALGLDSTKKLGRPPLDLVSREACDLNIDILGCEQILKVVAKFTGVWVMLVSEASVACSQAVAETEDSKILG